MDPSALLVKGVRAEGSEVDRVVILGVRVLACGFICLFRVFRV